METYGNRAWKLASLLEKWDPMGNAIDHFIIFNMGVYEDSMGFLASSCASMDKNILNVFPVKKKSY